MYNISYSVMFSGAIRESIVFISHSSIEDGESRLRKIFPDLVSFKQSGFKMLPDGNNGKYSFSFLPALVHGVYDVTMVVCADTADEAANKMSEITPEEVTISEVRDNSLCADSVTQNRFKDNEFTFLRNIKGQDQVVTIKGENKDNALEKLSLIFRDISNFRLFGIRPKTLIWDKATVRGEEEGGFVYPGFIRYSLYAKDPSKTDPGLTDMVYISYLFAKNNEEAILEAKRLVGDDTLDYFISSAIVY